MFPLLLLPALASLSFYFFPVYMFPLLLLPALASISMLFLMCSSSLGQKVSSQSTILLFFSTHIVCLCNLSGLVLCIYSLLFLYFSQFLWVVPLFIVMAPNIALGGGGGFLKCLSLWFLKRNLVFEANSFTSSQVDFSDIFFYHCLLYGANLKLTNSAW